MKTGFTPFLITLFVCFGLQSEGWGQIIELTPTDVGSGMADVFTTLPTDDPSLFGLSGSDVRVVDYDSDPNGNPLNAGLFLTNEYSSIGVTMNSIRIADDVYQGAASAPNATWHDSPQVYTFSVPVNAIGFVNTSPDQDLYEFYSGPDATGTLLYSFRDQDGQQQNFNIDRFVGVIAQPGETIGSIRVLNDDGNLEIDELIFQVSDVQTVTPETFSVTRGTYVSGDLPELANSDNSDLSAIRSTADIQSRVFIEFEASSLTPAPSAVELTLESAVFARSTVTQTLEAWDFSAGQWVELDSRSAARFTDSTVTIPLPGNPSSFVEAGTQTVRARVRYQSLNPRQRFSANVDQVQWAITN